MSTEGTTAGTAAGSRDLKRAVAFLTLDKVQRTPESARIAFLQGKGFTAEEIAEAQRQADEILKKRREEAASSGGSSSSTFGSAGAAGPWPLTRVAAPGGAKASSKVTVGGLSFVSLSSSSSSSSEQEDALGAGGDGEAAAASLLGRLLEAGATKADVAAVMLVVGPGQSQGAHRALDAWVDAEHAPVRQVVEQGGQASPRAQLFAVVRAR